MQMWCKVWILEKDGLSRENPGISLAKLGQSQYRLEGENTPDLGM